MLTIVRLSLPLALAMQCTLLAQPMVITSVGEALTGDARLAPGSRALIRVTQTLAPGSVTVQVGDKQAGIFGVHEDRVYVVVPFDVSLGPTTIVVASRGISTAPFSLTLVPHAPVLASTGFWPGIYCPTLAPWGTSLVAYGLGVTNPVVPSGAAAPAMPPASTVLKPIVTVAGREAEVLSSVLVPGRNDGSYAIDFRIPPGTPEGRHPIVLSIGGYSSNADVLRVASAIAKSAVSGLERPAAPEGIMSAFACAAPLATGEAIGDPRNPGTSVGGTSVHVKDSASMERLARLLYVSPRQVNCVIPPGTANGPATVIITSGDDVVSIAWADIDTMAPEFFRCRITIRQLQSCAFETEGKPWSPSAER